jgi:hypothetical protein
LNDIRYILLLLCVTINFLASSKNFDIHYYIQQPDEPLTPTSAFEFTEYELHKSSEPLNLGYQKGSVWVKIEVPKNEDISYFEITNPRFKEINYYLFHQSITPEF